MTSNDYAPSLAWTVERDPYEHIPDEVRYAADHRFRAGFGGTMVTTRKRRRRKALDDKPTVIVGMVLAGFAGAALATGASYGFVTHDHHHHAAPVVHVAPKPVPVKVYRYWVHVGQSSLRIGV